MVGGGAGSEEEEGLAHSAGTAQPQKVRHLGLLPTKRTALKRGQNESSQMQPKRT